MNIEPIGYVKSCYTQKFATPRQSGLVPSSWAVLELQPFIQPESSLDGIEGFSHIWLIFGFHRNTNRQFRAKIRPPRSPQEKVGVYATRSPHRWNPLGLSLVKLEKREENRLFLSGIDVVDGTPVYDIKPYLVQTEALVEASGGWLEDKSFARLTVDFAPAVMASTDERRRRLIAETLRLDPRPQVYKERGERRFVAEIDGCQVRFECLNSNRILVVDVYF